VLLSLPSSTILSVLRKYGHRLASSEDVARRPNSPDDGRGRRAARPSRKPPGAAPRAACEGARGGGSQSRPPRARARRSRLSRASSRTPASGNRASRPLAARDTSSGHCWPAVRAPGGLKRVERQKKKADAGSPTEHRRGERGLEPDRAYGFIGVGGGVRVSGRRRRGADARPPRPFPPGPTARGARG
jgi:hypothetical protein